MTAPIWYCVELDAVGEFHFFKWRKFVELALPLLLGAISAVLPALLFSISLFSQELLKLYGESRDVSRAHMSSRGLVATQSEKEMQIM